MKKIVAYSMTIAMVICGLTFSPSMNKKVSAVAGPVDSEWALQWSDEFNGSTLDTSVWGYDVGRGDNGWGNGEVQYYTSRTSNVAVTGGNLKISAKKESYNGAQYTSGRINSKNRKAFKFGKMEAKIKVEGGNQNGVWPAFWMMGNDYDRVGWPACGELDIMEHANSKNYTEGTLHWGPSWNSHSSWGSFSDGKYNYYSDNTNNGINGWHTYGVTWDENQIKWYMDDVVFLTANISSGMASHNYFTKDSFFILNLALGGTGTGYTNYKAPDSNFSGATMYVDYVRAYSYGGEPMTTQTPTATAAPETSASNMISPTLTVPTEAWGTFGIYKCYTGTWAGTNTAKAGVDPADSSHIIVQKTDNNYNNAWLTQVKLEFPELKATYAPGKYYYEWPIKLNGGDYSSKVLSSDGTNGDNNGTDIAPGYQTITGEIEVSNDGNEMPSIVIGMGWVNPNNTIEFFQPIVKDENGNKVYPEEITTTPSPTTTVKPTTTAKPTTTVKPTTTIKPTTTVKATTTVKPTTIKPTSIIVKPTTTVKPTSIIVKPTTTRGTIIVKPTTTANQNTTLTPSTASDATTAKSVFAADTDVGENTYTPFGNYKVYADASDGVDCHASAGVDESNPSHIIVRQTSSPYNSAWGTRVVLELPELADALNNGEVFDFTWPIMAANKNGTIICSDGDTDDSNNEQFRLTGEKQNIRGKVEVRDGVPVIVAGLGWVDTGCSVEFFEPTVKNSKGEVVYPASEKPSVETTIAPETAAPETAALVVETTNATTTKQSTSKITTSKPSGKVIVGKVTVKKIKKKRSARKIKVRLKGVSGATGYYIVVSKNKKASKVLKKKTTNKLKVTLKSKKFKNKKKLYVKARAYKLVKGITYFGPWSKPKKVKIK